MFQVAKVGQQADRYRLGVKERPRRDRIGRDVVGGIVWLADEPVKVLRRVFGGGPIEDASVRNLKPGALPC